MLMHNGRLSDPLDEITKELKKLTSKKKKTEDDHADMADVEWRGGLYWDSARKFLAIPSGNLLAVVTEGARKQKNGKQAQAAVFETQEVYPLKYDGPTTIKALMKDPRFRHRSRARVGMAAVMRTRPMIPKWSLPITLDINENLLNLSEVEAALEAAGEQVGLGDWRPRFGRFTVKGFKEVRA